jgi:hypothetical protein
MQKFRVLSLALSSLLLATASAQTNWSSSFKVSGGDLPAFESGILIPFRITALNQSNLGYALDAVSSRPDPNDPESDLDVGYLARFDPAGGLLWSVALDPGISATSLDLVAVPESDDRFFATYDEPIGVSEKAFRLGLFSGTNRTSFFAKRFVTGVTVPHYVEYFTGSQMGVTLDKGTTIESIVFDDTGQAIFNKSYTSPLFGTSIPGFLIQTLVRDLLPDQSAYLTAVSQSELSFDPITQSLSNEITLIPFLTNLAGEVTSSGSFQFQTLSPGTIPFPSILSDNSILYRIPASTGGITIGGTPIPLTHLIKVNPDGTLGWAKTVETSTILSVFPSPDAIYLAGSRPTPSVGPGASNGLVLKINPANGELMDQASFASIDLVDTASSLSSDGTDLFLQIFSVDPFTNQNGNPSGTTTLVKLNRDLEVMSASRYLGAQTFSFMAPDDPVNSIGRFLFSAHDPSDGSIKSISLDNQLASFADCDLFGPFLPTLETGITVNDLSVTSSPANVTDSNIQTRSTNSTINFAEAPLVITEICSTTRGLTIQASTGDGQVTLSFPTEEGVTYVLEFTTDLATPFGTVETVNGDGNRASFTRPIGNGKGFYRVSPPPPGDR